MSSDTIFAISSGTGMAGIAVIRVSGPGCLTAAASLAGPMPPERQASLRWFRAESGERLDQGILIIFLAPRSFTGEDCCEFHVHGGLAVQKAMLEALSAIPGLRPAEPGEFTRRALRNHKLDLMEVEGLSDLIRSRSDRQRRQALHHARGDASQAVEAWRRDLITISARVAAAIDFTDEPGVAEEALSQVRRPLEFLLAALRSALAEAKGGEAVRGGVKIVLAGPPNAGKSSLLNFLAKRDAAIVSPIPGTTRDAIEVTIELAGIPVTLTDTAGLRDQTEDEIEKAGMARTYREAHAADIIIWVTGRGEVSDPPPAGFDSDAIWVENKVDLRVGGSGRVDYGVSALSGEGMAEFMEALERRVASIAGSAEPPVLTRIRHEQAVRECVNALERGLDSEPQQIEMVAEELRLAGNALARLTGRIDVEDMLDVIFREFCIGK